MFVVMLVACFLYTFIKLPKKQDDYVVEMYPDDDAKLKFTMISEANDEPQTFREIV